jgi:hypothetical protein
MVLLSDTVPTDHQECEIPERTFRRALKSLVAGHQVIGTGETLERTNLRFRQWILDTCRRRYDQEWLDYQREIALRHTATRKNATENVRSTPYVPLRDAVAFVAVMNQTIKPYLASKGHTTEQVDKMHLAWCKSLQIQMALWIGAYAGSSQMPQEWQRVT